MKTVNVGDRVRVEELREAPVKKPWGKVLGVGGVLVKVKLDFAEAYAAADDRIRYRHIRDVVG